MEFAFTPQRVWSALRPCCIIARDSCSLSGCHLYFLPETWGVAHRLLQLSGFQPKNLYTRFHWPERPKLQQPVGNAPGPGWKFIWQPEGLQEIKDLEAIMQQGRLALQTLRVTPLLLKLKLYAITRA